MQPINYVVRTPAGKNLWWKIIAFTSLCLLLMGASYFAGYFKIFCPPCEQQKETAATKPSNPAPTPAAPADTVRRAAPAAPTDTAKSKQQPDTTAAAKPQPQAPKTYSAHTRYVISGLKARHTIRKGENIYIIARKYYGTKELAPYIISYNKLSDANVITVGSTLKIPELEPDTAGRRK